MKPLEKKDKKKLLPTVLTRELNWGAALFGSVSRETLCMAVVLVGKMNSLAASGLRKSN
jgi:hypothetical protein